MEPIRSLQNRSVVEAGRLHRARDRARTGATLVEGPHVLAEALETGAEVRTVFSLPDDPNLDRWPSLRTVDEAVMSKLAGTTTPRGPVAVMTIPPPAPHPVDRSILVLWGVGDPGNVGTIIRSAAAFGLGVGIGPDTADPWAPKVLRAGAGAHFRISLFPVASIEELAVWTAAALVVEGGEPPFGLKGGLRAIVVGSEAHGLPPDVVQACRERISIPMQPGVESLNAAVAASIVAHALGSGRAERGSGRDRPSH